MKTTMALIDPADLETLAAAGCPAVATRPYIRVSGRQEVIISWDDQEMVWQWANAHCQELVAANPELAGLRADQLESIDTPAAKEVLSIFNAGIAVYRAGGVEV